MRVVQLIDTLVAGGAERMAVNYANALASRIEFSAIVVSRKEGPLFKQINNNVSYLFLNRTNTIDFFSASRLKKFLVTNKVTVLQAHSTSFFLAILVKIIYPKIKIIWHDHYGDSEFLEQRPFFVLQIASRFFDGIISVNQKLREWACMKLKCKTSIYLPNFVIEEKVIASETTLKGSVGKRVVCLANLRLQKNHYLAIEVAKKIKQTHPEWTFHLIGKDFKDEYSQTIKDQIMQFDLKKNVFLYGSKPDIANILNQADIAILTSQSEGLPVALLEYGRYQKPVVVTAVGEIPNVIENDSNGFLIESLDVESFYKAVAHLIENPLKRDEFSIALYNTIIENYSEKVIISHYLNWLQNI